MVVKRTKLIRLLCIVLLISSFIIGFFPTPTVQANANDRSTDKIINTSIESNIKPDEATDTNEVKKSETDKPANLQETPAVIEDSQTSTAKEPVAEPVKEADNTNPEKTETSNELDKAMPEDVTEINDPPIGNEENDSTTPDATKVEPDKTANAQAILLTAEADGVVIEILGEAGILPVGTKLTVEVISPKASIEYLDTIMKKTGSTVDHLMIFDITLFDKANNEIQPQGSVEVRVSGLKFIKRSSQAVVYHLESTVKESGPGSNQSKGSNDELKINELELESGTAEVSFKTNHFSLYAIGTEATATYNFYSGTTLVDSQIILNGEKLKEPATPAKQAGKKFLGWYIDGQTTPINFNDALSVNSSSTYKVQAKFGDIFYVYFKYNNNIIKTKEVVPPGTTNDSDIPIVILEDGKALAYWSTTANGATFDFNKPITSDITLYAVLADRWKVTFDSQGGSPILPKYISNNSAMGTVNDPVRSGYTFGGWYTQANGKGTKYTATTVITKSIILYAKWTAKTDTAYTILYWQENPNDPGYTLFEIVTQKGITDQAATYPNRTYAGFNLNTTKTDAATVTIKGDGSSVKNVYFDRKTFILEFQYSNNGWKSLAKYTIKQGADTSPWWDPISNVYPDYSWYTTTTGNTAYTLAPNMPGVNLTVYGRKSTGFNYTIFYYEDGTGPNFTNVHAPFKFNNGGDLTLTIEDYVAFPGFTVKSTTTDGSQKYTTNVSTGRREWKIYYTRNKYDIIFQKNDQTASSTIKSIPYEADISTKILAGYTKDVTTRADGYIFKGWYDNAATEGNPYIFAGKKMPAGNLILYAKWSAPTYSIGFYKTEDGEDDLNSKDDYPAGSTISEADLTKTIPDGLDESYFAGWYWYLDGMFVPYDFNTPVINNNYVLYPVWKDFTYKVTYNAGDGSGTVPVDNNNYLLGGAANVLIPTLLTPPAGKAFIGWKNLNNPQSKTYYPNDKLTIIGNMTLTAQWGEIVHETKLTYKANGGVGTDELVTLTNNASHVVKQNKYTRSGQVFTGWNTKPDGIGKWFQPGETIIVGNGLPIPNELYAQWAPLGSLVVTKQLAGNYADRNKKFKINVTLSLPKRSDGKYLKWDGNITYGQNLTINYASFNAVTGIVTLEIELGDEESITFANIPYGVTYKVKEQDYSIDKYIVSYSKSEGPIAVLKETIVITNRRDAIIDTGVTLDSIPYILLIAIIAIGAMGGLIRKRKRTDYD